VIRFAVDRMLRDRFLAQNSEDGYTESAARGLKDEPPALHDHEWKEHVWDKRDVSHEEWVALSRERRFQAQKRRPPKHVRQARKAA
jgi:predicted DCC family thiol-disulfide oxidoreductase YuxK